MTGVRFPPPPPASCVYGPLLLKALEQAASSAPLAVHVSCFQHSRPRHRAKDADHSVLQVTQRLPLLLRKEVLIPSPHLFGLVSHEVVDDAVIDTGLSEAAAEEVATPAAGQLCSQAQVSALSCRDGACTRLASCDHSVTTQRQTRQKQIKPDKSKQKTEIVPRKGFTP